MAWTSGKLAPAKGSSWIGLDRCGQSGQPEHGWLGVAVHDITNWRFKTLTSGRERAAQTGHVGREKEGSGCGGIGKTDTGRGKDGHRSSGW